MGNPSISITLLRKEDKEKEDGEEKERVEEEGEKKLSTNLLSFAVPQQHRVAGKTRRAIKVLAGE